MTPTTSATYSSGTIVFIPQFGMISKSFGSLALLMTQFVPIQILRVGFAIFVPKLWCPSKSLGGLLQMRGQLFPVKLIILGWIFAALVMMVMRGRMVMVVVLGSVRVVVIVWRWLVGARGKVVRFIRTRTGCLCDLQRYS